MINVSDNFKSLSSADDRNIDFRIRLHDSETFFFHSREIIDVEIEQKGSDGVIGITDHDRFASAP
jgi:hypothetical protein